LRVRLIYNEGAAAEGGNRFYLRYASGPATGADCASLAADIAADWNTNLAPIIDGAYSLNEVDVLDISTDVGLSGQWTGAHAGTKAGSSLSANACTNVEFGIARRYRGGKPRIYLPPSTSGDLAGVTKWSGAFVTAASAAVAAFFTAVEAHTLGSISALRHVNLSYYSSFKNVPNTSGRDHVVPQYKPTATHDDITGYFAKAVVGSQKRRRTSTTP
jgi:hypothetical protein